jgi:large subunit ribosomal protein L6
LKGINVSRIGKKPITIEPDIKVSVERNLVHIEGPQGKMDLELPNGLELVNLANQLDLKAKESVIDDALHGLYRSLLQNAVMGVKKKWQKSLELVGVGFRAQTSGNELILNLGFSHPVKIQAPPNITFQVNENKIAVIGVDKYLVGEVAALVRRIKPPEPYKGKGIRYLDEYIRKKLGKAAKAVGAAGAK